MRSAFRFPCSRAGRLTLTGLCLLALFVRIPDAEARLRPYYVLAAPETVNVRPKVLVVMDTSNSMQIPAAVTPSPLCLWNDCETEGAPEESRISIARRVLRTAMAEHRDDVDFGLMTFDQFGPPSSPPGLCNSDYGPVRFAWASQASARRNGTLVPFTDINHYPGVVGMWVLCGARRPFPYLRWDGLGVGTSVAGPKATGALPPSPILSTDPTTIRSVVNAQRRVQWFPRFMGVRVHLDATSDPTESVLAATVGDYGSSADMVGLRAAVKNQDFYFWPYVDGFPGYSSATIHTDRDYGDYNYPAGVIGGMFPHTFVGRLYAPFFLDPAATGLGAAAAGPTSRTEADFLTDGYTSPAIEGGLEPASVGITPWSDTIGDIPASAAADNSPYSHTTVASYLKFVTTSGAHDACTPLKVIVMTDGQPVPLVGDPDYQGGPTLYRRLADLRRQLSARVYVIGMYSAGQHELNDMACAAAGACAGACSQPCLDSPANAWDTCADSDDPENACAFTADDADELSAALTVVFSDFDTEMDSGAGAATNRRVGTPGVDDRFFQDRIRAHTEYPAWRGHVVREACDDQVDDGRGGTTLAPWCVLPSDPPDVADTFGSPCGPSWEWDAGECLAQRSWRTRRVYTSDDQNRLVPLWDEPSSGASAAFEQILLDRGLVSRSNSAYEAKRYAEQILGARFDDNWRLPGLARSAPVVVRRIPKPRKDAVPSVPLADPHCAGRFIGPGQDPTLPTSLRSFADDAWDPAKRIGSAGAYESQEAVLIGDDLGVVHAFQLGSGAELWGYVPPFALDNLVDQMKGNGSNRGQPSDIDAHIFGVSATVNTGFVWDAAGNRWRNLAVFGMGIGGTEYVALDVSHMNPEAPATGRPSCALLGADACPLEVLWTTETGGLKAAYDQHNAETWARPALTYEVPNNDMRNEPYAYLVFGGGYVTGTAGGVNRGRTLVFADALTGTIERSAVVPSTGGRRYESDLGLVTDVAISTECHSKFWPELKYAYMADPAGRLYRWDLANRDAASTSRADSGVPWIAPGATAGTADELFHFASCQGLGATCNVVPRWDAAWMREPFSFGPAVTAIDRVDAINGTSTPPANRQHLIALISGASDDDATDGRDPSNNFHSSLYLLVDEHALNAQAGITAAPGQDKQAPGSEASYAHWMRMALTDIPRTRRFTPYPGAAPIVETQNFNRGARPTRAPRIQISTVQDSDGNLIDGVEVYTIEYYVHEPSILTCDARFYEPATDTWHRDLGSSYVLRFRIIADDTGIDFTTGTAASLPPGVDPSLTLLGVEQLTDQACADGVCGASSGSPSTTPCEVVGGTFTEEVQPMRSHLGSMAIKGFVPREG